VNLAVPGLRQLPKPKPPIVKVDLVFTLPTVVVTLERAFHQDRGPASFRLASHIEKLKSLLGDAP
jgi:hypothetical protein